MPKGETYVVFKARTKRRLNILMCTVWKHRRHLADHRLRLDVAEERLDTQEQNMADLKTAARALARIEKRRLEEEQGPKGKPRRRG